MKISVLGPGRWGSFIAWYLNSLGHNIMLWGRPGSASLRELKATKKNEWLVFDESITLSDNLSDALAHGEVIAISISAQNLRSFAEELSCAGDLSDKVFVLCMKGIEEFSGKRLSEVLCECIPDTASVAVWVGPGHVQDFARGIPNCMVIDSPDRQTKELLVPAFSSKLIRFYYGNDLVGTEIGAASKNVIGIAAGILDGLKYNSLKGALMARGTTEISRLIKAAGGNPISAYGLCHLGDYEATLFSPHSNNRMYGESFIKNLPFPKLAEGASTVTALMRLSEVYNVELPICSTVNSIIHEKKDVMVLLENLFSRSIKDEIV